MASAAAATATNTPFSSGEQQRDEADPIVQWVVLRRDLWGDQGWPLGPVIAQACHASAAALLLHLEDDQTRAYVAPDAIDHMHKVRLHGCLPIGRQERALDVIQGVGQCSRAGCTENPSKS
jgi:hypothetical protein